MSRTRKKKDPSGKQRNTRAVLAMVFFLSAVFLLFNTFLGSKSIFQLRRMQEEKEFWIHENLCRKTENRRLMEQIRAVRESPFSIEKFAREELGMVREDEIVYLFDPHKIQTEEPSAGSDP